MSNQMDRIEDLRKKVQFSGQRICCCAFPKPMPGNVAGTACGSMYTANRCEICKGIIVQTVRG